MTERRRIAVVTGTRAEYGLLYWLLRDIADDPALELQMIVTAMHLSPEFGMTVREIEQDGLPIAARVEMLLSSDTPVGVAKSMGLGTIGFADAFDRLRPDLVVVLGDRFEILAAAQAALVARIPIAHLHGGELTEGAVDESIRHALTKMASLHFTVAEPYRRRVLQLGEQPDRVFDFGAPGLDHLRRASRLSPEELERELGFNLRSPLALVTWHPATLGATSPMVGLAELHMALERLPDLRLIWTLPNADVGGRSLIPAIEAWAASHAARVCLRASLGHKRYLSLLPLVDVMVGNSSSGLTEAPALGVPTVNIGDRQAGRLRSASVIDVAERADDIEQALRRALSPSFRAGLADMRPAYGDGDASRRIRDVLREVSLAGLERKRFRDLETS
jgi:UDP-hydrolysing UDP-N-acetyl-D-glucosamine 2-epimerase